MELEGRAKGLLFNYLRDYLIADSGEQSWELALHSLTPTDQETLQGFILAGGWYPVRVWNRMIDFQMEKSKDPAAAMTKFCTYLGDRELNSLVKMMLKLGWPEFLLKRTGFLWNRYFDQGVFTAEELSTRQWRLRLTAPASETISVARLTCGSGPAPWLERGLHLSGTPSGRVEHTKCRWDGGPHCEFIAHW
ncbi:MAG: hypothetical protein Q8Q09_08935 [Deltaproteobacteria bacterium]|nr:hypothetical protein [Deltaproteobacteria bacterium]